MREPIDAEFTVINDHDEKRRGLFATAWHNLGGWTGLIVSLICIGAMRGLMKLLLSH